MNIKKLEKKNFLFWQEVMSEDIAAIEGMQKGRASPAYNGGNFSPIMDTPTHMFHKWVANNLTNLKKGRTNEKRLNYKIK